MKYQIMVSHGEFAEGLDNALTMLAGKRKEVLAVGLHDGMTADDFAKVFSDKIADLCADDEVVLLGDIIGGSPLTTAMNVLKDKGILANTIVIGGMNLPLALTSVLMKDTLDKDTFVNQVIQEATGALKELEVVVEDEDDDI